MQKLFTLSPVMKICIINNIYPPYDRGGAEQVVVKTVEGLLEAGHEVVIITSCPEGNHVETDGKLKIYRRRPKNIFYYTDAHNYSLLARFIWHVIDIFNFSTASWVKEILRTEKPDIVHTHNLMGLSFLIPNVLRKLNLRHIHTVHDVQLVEPSAMILKTEENKWRYTGLPTRIYTWLIKKLINSPQVVISPSQFLLDFYSSRGFFPNSKFVVVRNPVTFNFNIERVENERQDIAVHFLYLGQIEKHKGVDLLAEVFLEILKHDMQAELHIAGEGSLLEEIKAMCGDNDKIKIYGRVKREDLPDLFSKMDVTVVPSLCYENSPTVIFESLHFGVPVLASNIEGIAELIEEGENGLTFVAGDKKSLQEKLIWCVQNQEKLAEMSQKTTQSFVGLSQGDYVDKLEWLYQG